MRLGPCANRACLGRNNETGLAASRERPGPVYAALLEHRRLLRIDLSLGTAWVGCWRRGRRQRLAPQQLERVLQLRVLLGLARDVAGRPGALFHVLAVVLQMAWERRLAGRSRGRRRSEERRVGKGGMW